MAGFAGRGEIQGLVVNHARRVQVIHHVAGSAVRAQAGELPHGGIRVARNAVQRRMRPQEREAILVVLHVLNRDAPALHRVAFLAAASKLSAVQVRMAIHAFRSNAREDRIRVAGIAIQLCVRATEWERRFLVAEFGKAADRLPPRLRMAALAAKLEIPVRAARGSALRRLRAPYGRAYGQNCTDAELDERPVPHRTLECSRLEEGTD